MVGAQQLKTAHMAAKGTGAMVVLTVDIVRDGTTHGDLRSARHDRQEPARRNDHTQNVCQQYACLAGQNAGVAIKADKTVQGSGLQQRPADIETAVAVTAAVAKGQDRRSA